MSPCRPARERRIIQEEAQVEYWVLELAVTLRIPLAFLTSDRFAGLFNKRFDGFDRAELVSCLERLLAAGDIDVAREGEALQPDRAALEEALDRPVPPPPRPASASLGPAYGLTPRGGSRWESLAHADWEKYNPLSYEDREGTEYGEIIAMDRDRAERFLAGVKAYCRHSFIPDGPEEWDLLTPWHASYWKALPRGHRVRFRCRVAKPRSRPMSSNPRTKRYPAWFRELEVWFRRPFSPEEP